MKKTLLFLAVLLTAATAWAETQNVNYIDANGAEQTVEATVLTTGGWQDPGWYVVTGNIEASSLIFDSGGITNLILADGATLTLNDGGIYAFGAITIYGQKNGTGKFTNIPRDESDYALRANGDINIHGGVIEATGGSEYGIGISTMSWDEEQHITITGGKVTAVGGENSAGIDAHKGNITITGGQVNASGCWGLRIESNNDYLYTITLGCTSASDFICSSSNDGAYVKIVDGQTLVDDEGNEYSGTYYDYHDAYSSLFGKRLHLQIATFAISLPESFEHGTVTCDKQTAYEGETVTLTVTPDNGYELETLTVTFTNEDEPSGAPLRLRGGTVELTPGENGTYTFEMPAAPVAVNAAFKKTKVTGLNDIDAAQPRSGQRYNRLGQPVGKDYRGIVIEDGRKIYVE